MANDTSTAHMTPDELADYLAARLSESREEAIEMHLGVCDACAEEARQLRAFSAVWDDWTLQVPKEAWEQVALATALQQVQPQVDNLAWRERLARWQTNWQGKAAAAMRLGMGAADQAVRVVTEGLETLTTPGNRWGYTLASALGLARGLEEDQDASQEVATPEPASPHIIIRVGQASHAGARRIQVSVRGLPAEQVPPLVLLIPATAGGVPQVTVLAPRPGSAWFVAQFHNVPQGDYLLAFEPMGDTSPA